MINHRLKCIHVHIPKTAGRSLTKVLFGRPRQPHLTAGQYLAIDPKSFENYFKFSIVRNPWDRIVSYYHMCLTAPPVCVGLRRIMKRCVDLYGTTEFCNFVRLVQYFNSTQVCLHSEFGIDSEFELSPQYGWLYDHEGNCLMDYVGSFETLMDSYNIICDNLGVPELRNKLPRIGHNNRAEYQGYYDDTTKRIIGDAFAVDCTTFDYDF